MSGVPQKPVGLKKIEGTYRKDRDAEREKAEAALAERKIMLPEGSAVRCPKGLRTKAGRALFRQHTAMLIRLQVLAPADLPQVERLWVTFEKLCEAQAAFLAASPLDEGYSRLLDAWLKLSRYFDELGKSYYISPAARSRLALDALNAAKTAQEVKAGGDAIEALLLGRK